jgi:hypothetical protein
MGITQGANLFSLSDENIDENKHWHDMPEFKHEDLRPYKTIYVHFKDEKDFKSFQEVVEKFGRWHHQVDYRAFKYNELKLKEGVTISKGINNYGMVLNSKES